MNKSKEEYFKVECERLVLREYTLADLDAIYNLTLQPEIQEFLSDWIASKEQRKEWLTKYEIPENQEFIQSIPNIADNILRLAIVLKETNEVIGCIVSGMKEELSSPNREFGYLISRDFTCKGYATEAVQGLMKYLFEHTDLTVLNAIALTYNLPSNRVIQKSGFTQKGIVKIEGKDFNYYTISLEEYKNR